VIRALSLPQNRIHSCTGEPLPLPGTGLLVAVEYGEAQDCPSGCFYDAVTAVLTAEGKIFRVPFRHQSNLVTAAFPGLPGYDEAKLGLECQPPLLEELTNLSLDRINGIWGGVCG